MPHWHSEAVGQSLGTFFASYSASTKSLFTSRKIDLIFIAGQGRCHLQAFLMNP